MNSGPLLPCTSSTDYAQFLAIPISFSIDMEFCTNLQGRQANTLEQCVSIATILQALLQLWWRAPMIGHLYSAENRTFLLCIDMEYHIH